MINKDLTKLGKRIKLFQKLIYVFVILILLTFKAQEFFDKYVPLQFVHHLNDLKQLKLITSKEQLSRSDFKDTFRQVLSFLLLISLSIK